MNQSDDKLRKIIAQARVIACVGASANPARPSHYVSQFLLSRGFRVVPVNPGQAGKSLFGETAVATLRDINEPIDMIDIFRRPEHALPIVAEAIESLPDLRTIWMQKGIRNEVAAKLARSHGLNVVQDRCPLVEISRLFGDAHRADFAA